MFALSDICVAGEWEPSTWTDWHKISVENKRDEAVQLQLGLNLKRWINKWKKKRFEAKLTMLDSII